MNKNEMKRQVNLRRSIIAKASESGNVAKTCRHFGISQKTFYKWIKRYGELGEAGLCNAHAFTLVWNRPDADKTPKPDADKTANAGANGNQPQAEQTSAAPARTQKPGKRSAGNSQPRPH